MWRVLRLRAARPTALCRPGAIGLRSMSLCARRIHCVWLRLVEVDHRNAKLKLPEPQANGKADHPSATARPSACSVSVDSGTTRSTTGSGSALDRAHQSQREISADFYNSIGTFRTRRSDDSSSGIRSKADFGTG